MAQVTVLGLGRIRRSLRTFRQRLRPPRRMHSKSIAASSASLAIIRGESSESVGGAGGRPPLTSPSKAPSTDEGVPYALRLEGAPKNHKVAHCWNTTYALVGGREVRGRPVWRSDAGNYIVFDARDNSNVWYVCNGSEAATGGATGGFALIEDPPDGRRRGQFHNSPDRITASQWQYYRGGWVGEPRLMCVVAEAAPPMALRLTLANGRWSTGEVLGEKLAGLLGHYSLVKGTRVNKRPVWRATSGEQQHFIAYALVKGRKGAGAWYVQPREALGCPDGVLRLRSPVNCPSPHLVADPTAWESLPENDDDAAATASAAPLPAKLRVEMASPLPAEGEGVSIFEDDFTASSGVADFSRLGRGVSEDAGGRSGEERDADLPLRLFADVSPHDLNQGELGNCWFVGALAALAAVPGAVRALCTQQTLSISGRYDVSLFDPIQRRWVTVTVDDRLPVTEMPSATSPSVRLRFMKTSAQNEIWPVIYEKAMAKLYGSYDALIGGKASVALSILTGCTRGRLLNIEKYSGEAGDAASEGLWTCHAVQITPRRDGDGNFMADTERPSRRSSSRSTGFDAGRVKTPFPLMDEGAPPTNKLNLCDVLIVLRRLRDAGALLTASSKHEAGLDDTASEATGIVYGHCYTILDVRPDVANSGFSLIQLRNPWGATEWKGAWGDHASEWRKHPEVEAALASGGNTDNATSAVERGKNDGIFWMEAADFEQHFEELHACLFDEKSRALQAAQRRSNEQATAALSISGGEVAAEEDSGADAMPVEARQRLASCRGRYQLLPKRQINGHPVWRNLDQPDRYLAFSGSAWNVQRDSAPLGAKAGYICLPDAECSSPELSTAAWLASPGFARGWLPTAGLTCFEIDPLELPPPKVLRLSGLSKEHPSEMAFLMLKYVLVEGRLVQGRPLWRSHPDGEFAIAYNQRSRMWVVLAFEEDTAEDSSWEAGPEDDLHEVQCTAMEEAVELPPPKVLQLIGIREGKANAFLMRRYHLIEGRREHNRPLWRSTPDADGETFAIAYSKRARSPGLWVVCSYEHVGQFKSYMYLRTEAFSPDVEKDVAWRTNDGPQSAVRCIAVEQGGGGGGSGAGDDASRQLRRVPSRVPDNDDADENELSTDAIVKMDALRAALVGQYRCTQYIGTADESGWHHVEVRSSAVSSSQSLCWHNAEKVSWCLKLTGSTSHLAVGTDCPYYAGGHTSCKIERGGAGGRVEALLGPFGERYDRLS